MGTRMEQRRGTAAEAAAANPVLADGEFGWERDTGVIKIGDGVTHWVDLPLSAIHRPQSYNDGRYIGLQVMDAIGDLIVGTGDGSVGRLPAGAPGQQLKVGLDGVLFWETPPATDLSSRVPLDIFDAAGDLLIGAGDNVVTRLGKGTNGQQLTVVGGNVVWATPVDASSRVAKSGDTMTGPLTVQAAGAGGTNLSTGSNAKTGYVGFPAPNGLRAGYVGWADNPPSADAGILNYQAGQHRFAGAVYEGGNRVLTTASPPTGAMINQTIRGVANLPGDGLDVVVTIPAVNMAKTQLRWLGGFSRLQPNSSTDVTSIPQLRLSSSTTITIVLPWSNNYQSSVSYELTEWT